MQSLINRLICWRNTLYYRATEPLQLRANRLAYAEYYHQTRNPVIWVYIPTYNRADLLMERAVASVLAQSYGNWRLLVVGDHCTDETSKQMNRLCDRRQEVHWHNLPQRKKTYPLTAENHWLAGPVAPANAAIDLLRKYADPGMWIARLDDDDVWSVDHLVHLLHFAQQEQAEFVSSYAQKELLDEKPGVLLPYNVHGQRVGGTQTWLYRSYLLSFKYNPDCWRKKWNRVNDTDMQERMAWAGVRMGFLPEVTAYIRPRPGETETGSKAYKTDKEGKERFYG